MSALTIVHIVALVSFMIVVALALLTMGREKSAKPMTFFMNMSVAMFFLSFFVYITEFYFDLGALILLCLGVILGLLGGLMTKIYAKNGEVYSKKTRVLFIILGCYYSHKLLVPYHGFDKTGYTNGFQHGRSGGCKRKLSIPDGEGRSSVRGGG